MLFAHRTLAERRILRGLSRDALATACGISSEAIRRYELGKNAPRPNTAVKLADVLEIPVTDLWTTEVAA